MSGVDRPAQYKQPSRKGKKAWRKNIDLSDVEKGLRDKKELEITHGTQDISNLQDDKLFQVDDQGDLELKSKLIKRKQIKKNIKSKEILDAVKTNSKVEVVKHPKLPDQRKDKIQNVSKKELQRLLNLAGKNVGESKWKNRFAKEGLIKSESFDIWNQDSNNQKRRITTRAGIQVEVGPTKDIPKELIENSTAGRSLPSKKPSTLDRTPEVVREYEDLPHAGKSYNPDKKDWDQLLMSEYKAEKAREENRIAQKEYRDKIAHLMEVLGDDEESSSSSDEEKEGEEEEKSEQQEPDNGVNEDGVKLSVNEAVKNKKKTKHQRNKAKKHEAKVQMQEEIKRLNSQLHELEQLENIHKQVEEKTKSVKVQKPKKNKKHKLGTKYTAREANLEMKFSDELSDSLRKLKPEGNLLYDQMRKLQSTGKVETRIPVHRSKGNKPKITEKWTYKDFK